MSSNFFVTLTLHFKCSVIFGLGFFLRGAGGPGNPCYEVQACLVNFALSSFALHFKVLCECKATLPKMCWVKNGQVKDGQVKNGLILDPCHGFLSICESLPSC